jgi:membrane-associated phospholipid phosphatase
MAFYQPTIIILFSLLFASALNSQEVQDTVVQQKVISTDTDILSVQDSSAPYLYRINRTYLKTYWSDFKGVVSAPAQWKGRDWAKFGLVAGSAGIMMAGFDRNVKYFLQRNTTGTLDKTAQVFYPFGNTLPPFLLAGMYVTSVIAQDRKLEHSTLMITKSLFISTVIYTSSKALIRRQRPVRTDNPRLFTSPFKKNDYTSFPSGHSNTAFAVATAFAEEYKHKKWVPWVAYSLASFTALARMYQNRHWTSDVIIGSAIGHFVTKRIYKLEARRAAQRSVF